MQAFGEQQINKLKQDFTLIDNDHDGYINKYQLQNYMKQSKIFNIPIWKVNQMMEHLNNKVSSDDFVIWIMGCKSGLEDLAGAKFILFQQLQTIKSASPSSLEEKIKTSYIDFIVNKNKQQTKLTEQHFLKFKAGLDRKQSVAKRKQLEQVLGRSPSQINFVFKVKTRNDGQIIAEKLSEIAELGLALASQLGPTATPFVQSINLTTKYHNQHVYLIVQLNNTFINFLLKFIKEAVEELIPEGKCYLSAQIQSDFSQVLQPSFDPFSQSLKLYAQLLIGEVLMSKLKQKLIESIDKIDKMDQSEQMGLIWMFLFEELNLSMEFSDIKECFKSLGLQQKDIDPLKSGILKDTLKSFQISSIIKQFLPDGDQILKSIEQNCSPQGSLSLNISELSIDLGFNFSIQGFFDIL